MSTLEIELTPDLDHKIREEAHNQGQSPSEYVRRTLESLLAAQQTPARKHDAMEFAGVGREVLKDFDADRFIREMRGEWDSAF